MNKKELLDIYSDYLISAYGQTTGTGLAGLLEGSISHDQIQRLLSERTDKIITIDVEQFFVFHPISLSHLCVR